MERPGQPPKDRKSTRLNSSHLVISYAVFCLKKTNELPRYGEYAPKRLSVKPGITGLWQISRRQHISNEERVQLDMHYINTRTFVLDLAILVTTPHGYKPWASGMTRPCRPTASKASAKIFLLPLWSRSMTRPQLEHS